MIIEFDEIDSTNTYIENNLQSLPNHTLVRALYQSKGRGRRDHTWDSPYGENLLFSILIKEDVNPFVLSMCATLAITQVLMRYGGKAFIKFPNDIYVADEKICGLLTTALFEDGYQGTIIGIGLNVHDRHHYAMDRFTSCKIDLHKLMCEIDEQFMENRHLPFCQIIAQINERSYLKGKKINYKNYGEVLFENLNEDGSVSMNIGTKVIKIALNEINLGNMTEKL